jgi:hypothetical protein
MALSDCAKQVKWLQLILQEIGYILKGPIPICADNMGAILNASNPISERRTKHIDVRYHLIRYYVETGEIDLEYISGTENPAGIFTKPLGRAKFELFHESLGLKFYQSNA